MSPVKSVVRSAVVVITLAVSPVLFAAVPAAAAATTSCSVVWGSLPKTSPPIGAQDFEFLINVRSGQHTCYDRLVFDLSGNQVAPVVPGFSVRYVDEVRNEATGAVVPLNGGAKLEVSIGVGSFDAGSQSQPYQPADLNRLVNLTGYRTLRQVAWADDFNPDSTTTIGIGVRARLPMRAFILPATAGYSQERLVVDIAHRW